MRVRETFLSGLDKTIYEFHYETKHGVHPYDEFYDDPNVSMAQLEAEWKKFGDALDLMKARIMMGFMRYGPMGTEESKSYDGISSIRDRLEMFLKDGNGEHLIDIANIALVEFTNEKYVHFDAADDGYHSPKSV